MADEPWTFETFKLYFDAKFERVDAQLKADRELADHRFNAVIRDVGTALTAQQEALREAKATMEKRFDGVNEFRSTLADQQRTLMPRAEAELSTKSTIERIERLEASGADRRSVRGGITAGWGAALAVAGLAMAVWAMLKK